MKLVSLSQQTNLTDLLMSGDQLAFLLLVQLCDNVIQLNLILLQLITFFFQLIALKNLSKIFPNSLKQFCHMFFCGSKKLHGPRVNHAFQLFGAIAQCFNLLLRRFV